MTTPSIQHAEEIAQKWFPGTNTIRVDAIRSAVLDDELREVTHRRLSSINITLGQREGRSTTRLNRDEVTWLRDALSAALEATADFDNPPPDNRDPAGCASEESAR